jgi:NADH-ubiquinone oxidoreductase chain 5
MFNLVLILPLLNAFLLKFNRQIGVRTTAVITVSFIALTFFISSFILYFILFNGETKSIFIPLIQWFDLELLSIEFGGYYDTLSAIMLCVVTFISFCVHLYSLEYMKNDMHLQRFLAYLSLFTFFMIVLVTSNNFIQLFMGWEGVGLCSYLLINFWYTRIQANKAAIKAVMVNRIGDTAFAVAMFLIFKVTGALDFETVFLLSENISCYDVNLICFFLFLGAMGKSAQIGLHTWLPDAMEGPTPVSALIHAATMVTAGVFLIIRCSHIFQEANYILPFVTIIGSLTTFFAATTALVQTDLKRVIAYSTCSQLGYMVTACGISAYHASIFHLSNHAFFKALLFLTAGSIIHAMSNEQDMRKMGGLLNLLPFSYSMLLIGSLALMGFPFLSGYYSKDVILEIAYAQFSVTSHFAFWLGSLSAMFTSFYSMRLIFLTFLGEVNSTKNAINHVHDAPILMALPMAFLSIFSIFIGYLSRDIFVGLGTPFWGNSIQFSVASYSTFLNAEFLPFYIKIIPVLFSTLGTLTAIIYYQYFLKNFNILSSNTFTLFIYNFLNKKWYFDKIINEFIVQYVLALGYNFTYKTIDRGFLEVFGPTGITLNLKQFTTKIAFWQIGLPYNYIRYFVLGTLIIFIFLIFSYFAIPFEIYFIIFLITILN